MISAPGRLVIGLCLSLLIGGTAAAQPTPFAVGQVWTVKDPTVSGMRVRIGRLEKYGKGIAVSVTMLSVPCPAAAACKTTDFAHIPFDKATLASAVGHLAETRSAEPPVFQQGYAEWKKAKGGVFTISPAEVASVVFATAPVR